LQQAIIDALEVVKSDRIAPEPLEIDRMTKDIWDLLVHTNLVMQSLEETPLLKPYKTLMSNASNMRNAYLPVMPHDHLEETRAALLGARNTGGDDNPVFYCKSL
jgi:hypothetical protein